MRLLLIDDLKEYRDLVMVFLTPILEGVEFVQAGDGIEAIEILSQRRDFDLIISDFSMPIANGSRVFRHLREIQAQIPFILFSALPDFPDRMFEGDNFVGIVPKHDLSMLERLVRQTFDKVSGALEHAKSPAGP